MDKVRGNAGERHSWAPKKCQLAFLGPTQPKFQGERKGERSSWAPNYARVLLNCVNTIPVSTAECERGFSKMNVVCSSLRTRLTIMSSLIFVSLCCPPVHLWEPLKFVKSWVALNRRAADCTQGLKRVVAPPAASTAMKALWDAM